MISPFIFDFDRQQYRVRKGEAGAGRFVKKTAVRAVVDDDRVAQKAVLQGHGDRLKSMAAKLKAGEISEGEFKGEVALWRRRVRKVVVAAHLNYGAAGRGGIEQMNSAAYGRIGQGVKFHFDKLDSFADDIVAQPELVLEGVAGKMDFDQRQDMYVDTALFTYLREQSLAHEDAKFTRYRNVPHSQESCQSSRTKPGCDEITLADWQKINSLPPHGQRACGPKCECGWEYDKGSLDGIEPFKFAGMKTAFYGHLAGWEL